MNKDNLLTLEDFQNYININNIKSKKEFRLFNKYQYDRFLRLIPKEDRGKLIFENDGYNIYYDKFSKVSDFQEFIDENNILRPIEFKRRYPKIYDRLCRVLSSEDKKMLVYKNKINSFIDISTINKLQDFINFNKVHSKKELHKYFPGLYVKFIKELDKVKFTDNNYSLGENYLIELFTRNNIKFITQKTFPDLKNILPLRYDFYLIDYNVLIEHHGEGHFGKGKYYSEDLINNDKLKYKYAKDNNINILYYTIYKNDYEKYGYFTEVIVDPDILLQQIKLTN